MLSRIFKSRRISEARLTNSRGDLPGVKQVMGAYQHPSLRAQEGGLSEEEKPTQYIERLEKAFHMGSVSFPGRQHIYGSSKGAGNQDSRGRRITKRGIILVCSDGCSATSDSGTGSKAVARLVLNIAEKILTTKGPLVTPKAFAAKLQEELLTRIRAAATPLAADANLDDVLYQSYLCTVLVAVVTPHWTAIMGCGDGIYAINGKITVIPPRPGNQPEYLAYLLFSTVPKGFENIGIKVLKVVATAKLSSVVIATDGIEPVATQTVGGFTLSDVWQKLKFRDVSTLEATLDHLSQDRVECRVDTSVNPLRGKIVTTPGIFYDDTTLVFAVRDRSVALPAEWIPRFWANVFHESETLLASTEQRSDSTQENENQTSTLFIAEESNEEWNFVATHTNVPRYHKKPRRSLFLLCTSWVMSILRKTKSNVSRDANQHDLPLKSDTER